MTEGRAAGQEGRQDGGGSPARPALGAASRDGLQRAMIGFLLAAALFLIEAGWGEITLARNQTCAQQLRGMRLAPDPRQACASEFTLNLAESVSSGLVGVVRPEWPQGVAWLAMMLLYGSAGAGLAQLPPRPAVIAFAVGHAVLVALLMGANYLSQFIV